MSNADGLNFFDPNVIPGQFENQLTRALLVLLRMSPEAHKVWLSLAASGHKLLELPMPTFATQRWQMFESMPHVTEPIKGISVLLAADVQAVEGPVQITDRGQVLDGIVRYGAELLIVIGTKLDGIVATRQAQNLNIHGAPVRFDEGVRTVSWRVLLEMCSDLIENNVVAGTERLLILDFLEFVERRFHRLGPFTTLGRCNGHEFRVNRRLNAVLDEIADGRTKPWLELPGRSTVDRAYLKFDSSSEQIQLVVCLADTLAQARAFYAPLGAASTVLSLRDGDWSVKPNFHFGFNTTGLVWTTADASPEEYVIHWRERIAGSRALPREVWEKFWSDLVRCRFARTNEKISFDQSFTNSNRMFATPRPGLKCTYSWKLSDAIRLDDDSRLGVAVGEKLSDMLRALGEKSHEATTTN